jgi:KamA family protein
MYSPEYITKLERVPELTEECRKQLQPVVEKFVFRSNTYYNNLIDWTDAEDPIRKIVIPSVDELSHYGQLDASQDKQNQVAEGIEHKYPDSALLLVNSVCGAYCRYCFRKRIFMRGNDEVSRDLTEAINYIKEHTEINNVILSGGDPLILSTGKLEKIIAPLRDIDHVNTIRIGTKMVAYNPYRILNDGSLHEMIRRYSTKNKRIYIMSHFTHPRELTDVAIDGVNLLYELGARVLNQTPILKGINGRIETINALFNKLAAIGIQPYTILICRPEEGNIGFSMPIEKALDIFTKAKSKCSGLARTAKLIMVPPLGKIEILGLQGENILFRIHRPTDFNSEGKIISFKRNPEARWWSDFEETKNGTVNYQELACL